MLLAVEGGGFFSSSASGYTNGLALLLLGRRNEERPMRVSPWIQFQLVEQEIDHDPLASKKKQASRGCSSFICFNCAPEGQEGPSLPKACSTHQPEATSDTSSDKGKGKTDDPADNIKRKILLKSSLKKCETESSVISNGDDARDSLEEMQSNLSCCTQGRKVHWTDACGKELTEIREFELSDEYASDEDFEQQARRCECVIQ